MLDFIWELQFQNPEWLFLLAIIPLLLIWHYFFKSKGSVSLTWTDLDRVSHIVSWRSVLARILPFLRYFALAAFIIAMARPQEVLTEEEIKAEGIDIIMVMDLSSSMLAQDFQPDRLSVSKRVGSEFVSKRTYDRVGLVVFAGESFTQCPLTTDHLIVRQFMSDLECGFLQDGTAIGMGLASAVNRLKDSEAKSKVVILLTDGVNNAGYVKPLTAAEIAQEFDIKVYTIGVGSMGQALSPVSRRSDGVYIFGMANVEIDEALLRRISEMTEGKYFRATNEASLEQIYAEIDQLEKTELDVTVMQRYNDQYRYFLWIGLFFLGLEVLFRYSILRIIP